MTEALTLVVPFILLIVATLYATRHSPDSPQGQAARTTPPATVVSRAPEAVKRPEVGRPVTPPAPSVVRTPAAATASAGAPPTPAVTPVPATDATTARSMPAPDYLARGRHLTRLFYTGQLGAVWSAFLPSLRAEWDGKLAAFRAYREGGLKAYGVETGLLRERVFRDRALTYYTRTATFERGPQAGWTLIFGLDDRGKVREFGIVSAGLLPD